MAEPIYDYKTAKTFISMMKELHGVYGEFAELQMQFGLRFGDCANFTVKSARELCAYGKISLIEEKTSKARLCSLNPTVERIIMLYLHDDMADESVLWPIRITLETYNRKLKNVARELGLDASKISSHTLRKTFAYQLRTEFGVDIARISEQMNHVSIEVTRLYCGLVDEDKLSLTRMGL